MRFEWGVNSRCIWHRFVCEAPSFQPIFSSSAAFTSLATRGLHDHKGETLQQIASQVRCSVKFLQCVVLGLMVDLDFSFLHMCIELMLTNVTVIYMIVALARVLVSEWWLCSASFPVSCKITVPVTFLFNMQVSLLKRCVCYWAELECFDCSVEL